MEEKQSKEKAVSRKITNTTIPKWFPEFKREWEEMQRIMGKIQWIARGGKCT